MISQNKIKNKEIIVLEEGLFLALDLGGTNFRVLLLELKHGDLVREDVKQYHIR